MIKAGNFIVVSSLAIIFLLSVCKEEVGKYEQQAVTGNLVSHSECKSYKSAVGTSGEYDFSSIIYHYQPLNHILKISHINSGFNCCPDSIYCQVNLTNDTIGIFEYEEKAQCNCDCLFDLNIEVNGVEAQSYFVKVVEPYVGDQAKLQFTINLAGDTTGTFTVDRNVYPWMD